jgi:hypothetical protein
MQQSTDAPMTAAAAPTGRLRKALLARRHSALKVAVVGAGVLVSAACGGHGSRVALPSTRPPAAPSAGSPMPSASASATTLKDAVINAYTAFFPAVNRALTSPPDQARSILQDYATGSYLDFEIRQIMDHQARHLEPWGKPIVHVTHVELDHTTAKVHDCQDASNAGLADARTHRLVPASRGNAHRNLIADMTQGGDGRWRLADLTQYPATCHAS